MNKGHIQKALQQEVRKHQSHLGVDQNNQSETEQGVQVKSRAFQLQ